ncbi:GlxA family transcriptional regulator [Pseudodesulfovibrio sediminis]|uniref:Transcriptional regulator n=1 Tax=Pseudodesulfovibrio sediminis TaxID=2810563 RepID=A0ABN6EUW7_9BACT|nr:GlxA family transcriptional regulator [Pseudodesulfovibrio sediminis]BCS88985.1 transcriptional regulator [Pseudodesulfovibrio sediminis]
MFFVIAAKKYPLYPVSMKKRMEFYFYQGMVALDVTGPLDVFNAADEILSRNGKEQEGYELTFSANTPGPIPTSSGLCFHADVCPGLEKADTLLVPGGMIAETASTDSDNIKAIQMAARKAKRIVSVCSGAFLLASAGILDDRRATTHWMVADRLAALYPNVHMEPDSIYVQDGTISTSAGVTAGIDLALALVEEDYGPSLAIEVARLLLLYRRRPGNQSQFSTTLAMQTKVGERFKPLVDWIETHLDQKLTVDLLAEKAHMSSRTFARIFPSETGMSPGRFIEQLRIDRARELLESGAEGLEQVARESGFGREERLRRAFQRRLGISPTQYRAHFIQGEHHDHRSYLRDTHL